LIKKLALYIVHKNCRTRIFCYTGQTKSSKNRLINNSVAFGLERWGTVGVDVIYTVETYLHRILLESHEALVKLPVRSKSI
jgi:hypothetical protein